MIKSLNWQKPFFLPRRSDSDLPSTHQYPGSVLIQPLKMPLHVDLMIEWYEYLQWKINFEDLWCFHPLGRFYWAQIRTAAQTLGWSYPPVKGNGLSHRMSFLFQKSIQILFPSKARSLRAGESVLKLDKRLFAHGTWSEKTIRSSPLIFSTCLGFLRRKNWTASREYKNSHFNLKPAAKAGYSWSNLCWTGDVSWFGDNRKSTRPSGKRGKTFLYCARKFHPERLVTQLDWSFLWGSFELDIIQQILYKIRLFSPTIAGISLMGAQKCPVALPRQNFSSFP
jgi:hypothetical protein